ncbi:hypothetical protein Lalb_Chr23g0275871 [Lupinus albus]|uniref:Uncharacterized protein n=1 Tax=Lupinus albus TaxID=3870 RepID=A0A6A4NFS0_LUPAL|nr:hypothetical protein Lalb_Chr23g0275871 [Lupinus albus]
MKGLVGDGHGEHCHRWNSREKVEHEYLLTLDLVFGGITTESGGHGYAPPLFVKSCVGSE